jgi:hypothetical protein
VATIEEKNILTTHILPVIGASHARLPQADLTGFLAMTGHLYEGGLMVIGRAVNGWTTGVLPTALLVPANAHTYANTVFQSVTGENCPMGWVAECWGAATGYNTRKSAFWRAIRAVVHGLGLANVESPQWPSHLVWSNLYKVAPATGGNPNSTLCLLQLPGCIDLLRLELATYMPSRLLFLTGMDWVKPFLGVLGAPAQNTPALRYVEGFGQGNLPGGQQVNFAIASHPQGKPEALWVHEVLQVLSPLTNACR